MTGKFGNYVLGYLHGDQVSSIFMDCVVSLFLRGEGYPSGVFSIETGPALCYARNLLVRKFLDECNAKYLLMIDTDMLFPADVFHRLVYNMYRCHSGRLQKADNHRPQIVGGLCCKFDRKNREVTPLLYDEKGELIEKWSKHDLVSVGYTGAACLLIPRTILEEVKFPWFKQAEDGSIGEDHGFCRNVRAHGFEIVVDTSTIIGHVKTVVIGQQDL